MSLQHGNVSRASEPFVLFFFIYISLCANGDITARGGNISSNNGVELNNGI
jgi:hypothetical protein